MTEKIWGEFEIRVQSDIDRAGLSNLLQHAKSEDASSSGCAERELGNISGIKILLAEDNEINQDVICLLLQSSGLYVKVADNGQTAVDLAKTKVYDLILMDIQMPVLDGLQATKKIREIPELNQLPIIAMTANAFSEDRQKCMEAGMNDFLAKPVITENLYVMLHKYLSFKQPGGV